MLPQCIAHGRSGREGRRERLGVGARVSLGANDSGGFELAVVLEISLPALSADDAQALTAAAHQVCPYSNATRGNIDVTLTLAED